MIVVCVKEGYIITILNQLITNATSTEYIPTDLNYDFLTGEQFELSIQQPENYDFISIVINIKDKEYDVNVMKNYFVTLDQWRDIKLNSILDK